MKYPVNTEYLLKTLGTLLATPSPVGYYIKLSPVLEALAAELGQSITYDNKNTAYITLEGEDNTKTVLVAAHADTNGLVVRRIDGNGILRIRPVGGENLSTLDGETVTVHTRDGREYTGLITCQSHSVHVFEDARTMERTEKTMMVLLDEPVKSEADVRALGIRHGDYISVEPRLEVTEKGYVKSRYLDDKAAVACCFEALRHLTETGAKPKYRTMFAFPYYEEIGIGGTYVPPEVSEYVAIDIGLIGPDYDGNERTVSICTKDNQCPYDYRLTNELIACAEKADCKYAVDIYYRYGTDANAAMRAGNNIRNGTFGMAVYCSHGRERTHIDGLANTVNLLLAYLLDR